MEGNTLSSKDLDLFKVTFYGLYHDKPCCLSSLSTLSKSKKMVAFSLFGRFFFGAECISSTLG